MRAVVRSRSVQRHISLLALCLLAGACDRAEHYATRGLVRATAADGERSISVHHERIANFKDREGKTAPMPSMVMIFGLDKSLKLPAPGAKLALEFDVRWNERPTLLITRLEVLPEQTALTLSSEH